MLIFFIYIGMLQYSKNIIMSNKLKESSSYDYVEIGGLRWATKNVGARTETDTGLYFQWGDTNGYTSDQVWSDEKAFAQDFSDYKYYDDNTFTKYNETYGKTELELEDDAAHVNMGGDWRMPTQSEFELLIENTTNEWVDNYNDSGVNGRLFTDKADNGKKLFFPASGFCYRGSVYRVGEYGNIWGRSLSSDFVYDALRLEFDRGGVSVYNNYRCIGFVVRGVINTNNIKELFEK